MYWLFFKLPPALAGGGYATLNGFSRIQKKDVLMALAQSLASAHILAFSAKANRNFFFLYLAKASQPLPSSST
jgi:hypothetical protein